MDMLITPFFCLVADADDFVNRSIWIGNALQFRTLLHDAQRGLLEKDVPYIYSVVHLVFDQVYYYLFICVHDR